MNTQKTKQYSQIFDIGIDEDVIAQIGEDIAMVLVVLSRRMNKDGECWPSINWIARKLGKSSSTIKKRIHKARTIQYKGEPVLRTIQLKKDDKGRKAWATNKYTFSKPIREVFINRYYTEGKKLSSIKNEENSTKNELPRINLSPSQKVATNDNNDLKENNINDMKKSLSNKMSMSRYRSYNEDEEF